mgnify:FL=1
MNRMYILLGVIAIAGMFGGSAFAESIKYTGDNLPLNIHVYQNDVLYFTGSDRINHISIVHPAYISQGCEQVGDGGTCSISFSDWKIGQHEYKHKGTASDGKITVVAGTNYADVSESAKNFKGKIEELIAKKLAPLEAKVNELQNEITMYQENIAIVKAKLVKAETDSSEAIQKITVLSSDNAELKQQIGLVEKYKIDASNWRAVALEQLKVMAEVLGLF